MAKISKKAAMLNTLICNVLIAKDDYVDGKISLETLEVVYKQSNSFVMCHLSDEAWREFRDYHAVKFVKNLLKSA